MGIEYTFQTKTIGQLFGMQDELDFSLAVQRQEDLWTQEARSLLIHSALYGFPVPAIWSVEKHDGNIYGILDGKQRIKSAIFKFIKGKYELKLDDKYAIVNGENVNGKTFEQLSDTLQKKLLNTSITINFLKNITEDEIEEFFKRINAGLSLTQIEITRVLASSKIMSFVQEIASNKFFAEKISLTENNRKRFIDEELILQIFALVINEDPVGLSGAEIRAFAKQLRHTGISDKHQEIMRNTTEYLDKAMPDKAGYLKKIHIPILFKMAIQAQELSIPEAQFGGWIQAFFAPKTYKSSSYYVNYSRSKTASLQNVQGRLSEMQKFFDSEIETAKPYKTPTPGQRGRKPKEIPPVTSNTPPDGFVASVEHLTLKPLNESNSTTNSSDENWEEFKQEFPNDEAEKVV